MSFLWHKFWEEDGRFVWLSSGPGASAFAGRDRDAKERMDESEDIAEGLAGGTTDEVDDLQEKYQQALDDLDNDVHQFVYSLEEFIPEDMNIEDGYNELQEVVDTLRDNRVANEDQINAIITASRAELARLHAATQAAIENELRDAMPGRLTDVKEKIESYKKLISDGTLPDSFSNTVDKHLADLREINLNFNGGSDTSMNSWLQLEDLLGSIDVASERAQEAKRQRVAATTVPVRQAPSEPVVAGEQGTAESVAASAQEGEATVAGEAEDADTASVGASEPVESVESNNHFSQLTENFPELSNAELTRILNQLKNNPSQVVSHTIDMPQAPFNYPGLEEGLVNTSIELTFKLQGNSIKIAVASIEMTTGNYDRDKIEAALPDINLDAIKYPYSIPSGRRRLLSGQLIKNPDGTFSIVMNTNSPILLSATLDKDISNLTVEEFSQLINKAESSREDFAQMTANARQEPAESQETVPEGMTYREAIAQQLRANDKASLDGGRVLGSDRLALYGVSKHNDYNIDMTLTEKDNEAILVMNYSDAVYEQNFTNAEGFKKMYPTVDVALLPKKAGQSVNIDEKSYLPARKPPPFGGLYRERSLVVEMTAEGKLKVSVSNIRFGDPLSSMIRVPLGKPRSEIKSNDDILFPPGFRRTSEEGAVAAEESDIQESGVEAGVENIGMNDVTDLLEANEALFNKDIVPALKEMKIDFELFAEMPGFLRKEFPIWEIHGLITALHAGLTSANPNVDALYKKATQLSEYTHSFNDWGESFPELKRKYKKFKQFGVSYNMGGEGGAYGLDTFQEHFGTGLAGKDMREIFLKPTVPFKNKGMKYRFDIKVGERVLRSTGRIESASNWEEAVAKAVKQFLSSHQDADVSDEGAYQAETYTAPPDEEIDEWSGEKAVLDDNSNEWEEKTVDDWRGNPPAAEQAPEVEVEAIVEAPVEAPTGAEAASEQPSYQNELDALNNVYDNALSNFNAKDPASIDYEGLRQELGTAKTSLVDALESASNSEQTTNEEKISLLEQLVVLEEFKLTGKHYERLGDLYSGTNSTISAKTAYEAALMAYKDMYPGIPLPPAVTNGIQKKIDALNIPAEPATNSVDASDETPKKKA